MGRDASASDVRPPPGGGIAMRWIVTVLIVAMFAWANIAPQAAWADPDVDRLKKRLEDAKDDVKRDLGDAKGDAEREK